MLAGSDARGSTESVIVNLKLQVDLRGHSDLPRQSSPPLQYSDQHLVLHKNSMHRSSLCPRWCCQSPRLRGRSGSSGKKSRGGDREGEVLAP